MGREKNSVTGIAKERVKRLLDLSSSVFEKRPELAHRYVELAWRIKTKYNLKLSDSSKTKFCRKCRTFWVSGETCRVRLRSEGSSRLVITCLNCGYERRIPTGGEGKVGKVP